MIPDQFLCPIVEVLLADAHAFAKRRWCRLVKDTHSRARAAGDFDTIEGWSRFRRSRADGLNLPRQQWVRLDGFVAVQLGRRDELRHPIRSQNVAEISVAKLRLEDAFLLLFDPATSFK